MHSLKNDRPNSARDAVDQTELDERLHHVAVLGGAGKMGRGITLVLLLEMARTEATAQGTVGNGGYRLRVIDADEDALHSLYWYLKPHIIRWAEKNINFLRKVYETRSDLIDNEEIIHTFTEEALRIVYPSSSLIDAAESLLIFEAIVENVEVKAESFRKIEEVSDQTALYFTNTSSIPIRALDDKAHLENRIVGFHFYNPPPKQILVELIAHQDTLPILVTLAHELGARIGKKLVPSNDVAGFIGNGHFLRELSAVFDEVDRLKTQYDLLTSLVLMDTITRDLLIRPMGLLQLLDYVGLDVANKISGIMEEYIPQLNLNMHLVHSMVERGIYGGQNPDGSQKNGIFQYEKGIPNAIYCLSASDYRPLPDIRGQIGNSPSTLQTWKSLSRARDNDSYLASYFTELFASDALGARLAKKMLLTSRTIAKDLVETGVAEQLVDVNAVLQYGFAHLYGPFNEYY